MNILLEILKIEFDKYILIQNNDKAINSSHVNLISRYIKIIEMLLLNVQINLKLQYNSQKTKIDLQNTGKEN
jgi:hypothetical protein